MRYLRFTNWLTEIDRLSGPIAAIWFEEVRRHAGTDASHIYGGLMATLTAWAELRGVPYEGVPVGTIKRHATGKGNADKDAMIAAVRARGFSPADDNEADAIAILLWAIETNGRCRMRMASPRLRRPAPRSRAGQARGLARTGRARGLRRRRPPDLARARTGPPARREALRPAPVGQGGASWLIATGPPSASPIISRRRSARCASCRP